MSLSNEYNAENTRKALGMRLGEIIENVIGDDRIRTLFDEAGGHPEEYEGKPTGLIALDMGVISKDTKTALLIAQAAERTLTLAEETQKIEKAGKVDPDNYRVVSYDDNVFKFGSSPTKEQNQQ